MVNIIKVARGPRSRLFIIVLKFFILYFYVEFFVECHCLFTLASPETTFTVNWVTGRRGSSSSVRWHAATAPGTYRATSPRIAGKRHSTRGANIRAAIANTFW